MSVNARATRGILLTWFGRAAAILLGFFVTPAVIHGLGDTTYGIWSIVMALSGYLLLTDLGVGRACIKYVAQFDARHDWHSVRALLSTAMWLYSGFTLLVLATTALIAGTFPAVVDTSGHSGWSIFWAVMFIGLYVSVKLMTGIYFSSIVARKRFDVANLTVITAQIAQAICILLVVRAGGGLVWMAAIVFLVAVVERLALYLYATRVVLAPSVGFRFGDRGIAQMLATFGSLTALAQAVANLGNTSGTILIGIVLGPGTAAYYRVAESLAQKSCELGRSVGQVVMPLASQFDSHRDRERLTRIVIVPTRLLLSAAFLATTIYCVLGYSFIRFWIGVDFADNSYPVLCILSLTLPFQMSRNGVQSALMGMGRVAFLSRIAVVEGLCFVGGGIVLVFMWGPIGMAWAILLGRVFAGGLAVPVFASKMIGLPVRALYWRTVVPAAVATLPALVFALAAAAFFPADRLLECVLQVFLVAAISAISTFFFCFDNGTRTSILRSLGMGRTTNKISLTPARHDS